MKFLFGILNPRQLPFFLKSLKALDYVDVLLAQNMELVTAITAIRNYFLKSNYDYLLFTSDNVTIPYLGPHKLIKDIEETGYDIITGWSPISPQLKVANIGRPDVAKNVDTIKKKGGYFPQKDALLYTVKELEEMLKQGKRIIPIWFTGWSITAMSRAVVENWTPLGWVLQKRTKYKPAVYKGEKGWWCQADYWYSYELGKKGFKAYADLTVRVPHTRTVLSTLLVGKERPRTILIKAEKPLSKVKG